MMREFEKDTFKMKERLIRQLNDEKSIIREKIFGFLWPRIRDMLREYKM